MLRSIASFDDHLSRSSVIAETFPAPVARRSEVIKYDGNDHAIEIYDGSNFKLYVNGALDSSRAVSSSPCQNSELVKMAKEVSS